MKHPIFFLAMIFTAFLSSCSEETNPRDNVALPIEYSYDVTISCFCPVSYVGPHELRIRNGEVVSYRLKAQDQEADESIIPDLRIETLDKRVEQLLMEDPEMSEVAYHITYGFAENAYFDMDSQIADEEWGFIISNFVVIE